MHDMSLDRYPNISHATISIEALDFAFERNPMVCDEEMILLLNLCRGKKNVLEIGTWKGITTGNILVVADHVVSIDVTEAPATLAGGQSRDECLPSIEIGAAIEPTRKERCLLKQYNPNIGGELDLLLKRIGDEYDLIIIDGDHSDQGVKIDYNVTRNYLAPEGIMIFHDCWWDVEPPPVVGPLNLLQREGGAILNGTHWGTLNEYLPRITK